MRDGCAGFFTAAELDAGKGIVRRALDLRPRTGSLPADWQELVPMAQEAYDAASSTGSATATWQAASARCSTGLDVARPLTIPGGRMRLVHRVLELDPRGGRYGLGLIRAEADIHPDDWFLTCHFVDDRVMPGTLMYECCLHTLRIFLLRMGWVAEAEGAAWEPVPGVASRLRCRGQVLETTRIAAYEVSIRELGYRPEPYAVVDALMYADGKPIVEITNMSVRLTGTTKEQLAALWRGKPAATLPPRTRSERREKLHRAATKAAPSTPRADPGLQQRQTVRGIRRTVPGLRQTAVIARLPGPPTSSSTGSPQVTGEPWRMARRRYGRGPVRRSPGRLVLRRRPPAAHAVRGPAGSRPAAVRLAGRLRRLGPHQPDRPLLPQPRRERGPAPGGHAGKRHR